MLDAALAAKANHVRWPAGAPFVRGFSTAHQPLAFNPSAVMRRFRPVYDSGAVVPSAYGAETGTIALAETVLRRAAPVGGVLHLHELRGLGLVKVSFPHDLDLLQLDGAGAQALHDANRPAHGIVWTSHQADDGDAFILWGTRLDPIAATILEGPIRLDEPQGLALVQATCERLGVLLVA